MCVGYKLHSYIVIHLYTTAILKLMYHHSLCRKKLSKNLPMVLLPSFFKILAYFNAYKLNDNEPWTLPRLFFIPWDFTETSIRVYATKMLKL